MSPDALKLVGPHRAEDLVAVRVPDLEDAALAHQTTDAVEVAYLPQRPSRTSSRTDGPLGEVHCAKALKQGPGPFTSSSDDGS